MTATTDAALDNAFSDDLEERIERVLLRYRPILTHATLGRFRDELHRVIERSDHVKAWLPSGPFTPAHAVGTLTAAQVALLGGTRPTRILHGVAHRLELTLDGGDKKSLAATESIFLCSLAALESFVEHHPVVPVKRADAGARRLGELLRLGVAAQIAAVMGSLYGEYMDFDDRAADDGPAFVRRYFGRLVEVFGRLKLDGRNQSVFRDYYIDAGDIDELADERSGLEAEVQRRHAFLKHLADALEAEIRGTIRVPITPALNPATVPAVRPRKR